MIEPTSLKQFHLLICGLGSIGRRHLKWAEHIGIGRIDVFRSGKGTLSTPIKEKVHQYHNNLEAALDQSPDAVIVSNPSSLHFPVAMEALKRGIPVLVEKPMCHTLAECRQLSEFSKASDTALFVAQNFRFHPLLQAVHHWIETHSLRKSIHLARSHFGAYLPEWHPWEDYHHSYAARKSLGGGALLTHVHEVDYLYWVLGPFANYHKMISRQHPLQTEVDESSALMIEHHSGCISTCTLSLAQFPPQRSLELILPHGTCHFNLLDGTYNIHADAPAFYPDAEKIKQDIDITYRDQLLAFILASQGYPDEYLVSSEEAYEILQPILQDER